MARLRLSALVTAAVLVAAVVAGCGSGQPSSSSSGGSARTATSGVFGKIPSIVRDVGPSVVTVLVGTDGAQGEGAGVIWSEDGMIVTNNHVTGNAGSIEVVLASGDHLAGKWLPPTRSPTSP